MEVEEAVTSHPDVVACAAFSAAHSVLQEVVGLVLVMKESRPRLDLRALHVYLGERLAAPKWPQVLVYMNGLPKSHTNKLLRVKLGSRLGLPELNDGLSPFERLYEGKCPPKGANLDVPILVSRVKVSALDTEIRLRTSLLVGSEEGKQTMLSVIENPTCKGSLICYAYNLDILEAIAAAQHTLDGYAVPTHFIELDESTAFRMEQLPLPRPTDSVVSILQAASQSSSGPVDPLVESIQNLFVQLLKLDCVPAPDANFFHLGGSSLLASQFASQIRKQFDAACSGAEIFSHSSPEEIADMIRKRSSSSNLTIATSDTSSSRDDDASELSDGKVINDHGAPFSSTRLPIKITWWSALVQLIPALVLLPLFQVTRYMLFFAMLLKSLDVTPGERDLWTFVLAYLAFHLCWITVTPLVFVAIKWIVVGKYRKGRYPLYGTVYLRWWFVDVCRQLFLRGIWGSNETFLNFYYRLLGAKIGKGARISLEADIAEFDLVSIGENAAVEMSTVRAFGVDNGAMILGPVSVGKDASVGVRSVVAPFTSVPDCKHLGPLVSSYDVSALDETHARTNRRNLPEPNLWMQFFVAAPIAFLVNCVGQLPPLLMLWGMLCYKAGSGEEFNGPNDLIAWLCDPYRIPFYFGIRIARALVAPFFYMGTAIAVKKFLIGRFEPGRRNTNSQWQLTRHHLVATLFSRKKIQAVTDIIGRHYELVSCLYRMMGARVGKRVFWPGNQPVFSGEFDLLVIGDDVVFGSRSCIFFTTTDSCEKVILSAGANVADNCVVLPGSIVGKNAVLGSNSVCPPGWYLPELSLWLGAKGSEPTCLERGPESDSSHLIAASAVDMSKLQVEGDASTIRPFGKAFYERKATYYVWSLNRIIWTTVTIKVLIAVFHSLPLLTALQGAASLLYGSKFSERDFVGKQYNYPTIYLTVLYVFLWVNVARLAVWFAVELIAKWSIIGRRAAGRYNYDSSDYAQRWELYQLVAKVRAFSRFNFLQFFFGSPYMTYFFRFMGGQIGKDCCLYPSGADPFMPEPDLVEMGDRCVVDCASIVCHLNTRGNFELVKIVMEDDCTLRSRSRVQQGVYMEQGSQLLEKSLAMTGEVIDAYSVWHGSPAAWWFKYQQIDVPFANDVPLDDSFDETTKLLKGKTASYYAV
jgi:acetyltransferase-like isoleucine patch superfamily enzyme